MGYIWSCLSYPLVVFSHLWNGTGGFHVRGWLSIHNEIMDLRRLLDFSVRLAPNRRGPLVPGTCQSFVQWVVLEQGVKVINRFTPALTESKDTPVQRKPCRQSKSICCVTKNCVLERGRRSGPGWGWEVLTVCLVGRPAVPDAVLLVLQVDLTLSAVFL